jgi:hypothetical protein
VLLKETAKAEPLIKQSQALIGKLDDLEAKFHNPKAEVTYDILAMKGGARLYSQMALLYEWLKDSDGPITQGMRDVYADQSKELTRLEAALQQLLTGELARLNEQARTLDLPFVVAPARNGSTAKQQ